MRHEGATLGRLQEAWITGAIEHPGIVPVHDIRVADDGRPLVVFKRIGGGDGARLSPRTDVYPLGGLLHSVLMGGRPPHSGGSPLEIALCALQAARVYPEDLPPELVEIAERAMAREPEDRYESGEALRRALLGTLINRRVMAAFLVSAARPDLYDLCAVLSNGLLAFNAWLVWRRPHLDPAAGS